MAHPGGAVVAGLAQATRAGLLLLPALLKLLRRSDCRAWATGPRIQAGQPARPAGPITSGSPANGSWIAKTIKE